MCVSCSDGHIRLDAALAGAPQLRLAVEALDKRAGAMQAAAEAGNAGAEVEAEVG
jgi:hypothetical protein